MNAPAVPIALAAKDFKSDYKPVWCPGCGDYSVLSAITKALASLQLRPENVAVVSGIGCSSRLPGYVATYGFNGVHGRALTLATGIKVSRPDLEVIAVGGDGDGLAIGGTHFMHSARRNLDVTYLVMDNEIYGLTKGQVAPTTPSGDMTKSTHYGNPEPAVDPCELAISFGATWVGRAFSGDLKGTVDLMVKAISHHGFSFLNVMSPCVTWRGDDQHKTLRAKVRPVPADHDVADAAAALLLCNETESLTTGILFDTERSGILGEMLEIRWKAQGEIDPPTREEMLDQFMA
jgi:2-oxoglutarate ferredoxin oxidoreductase subunit beta